MKIPHKEVAPHIPNSVGLQVRVNHTNCPAGEDTKRRLYVLRNRDAVLAYCHNCGGHYVSRNKTVRGFNVIQELLKEHEKKEQESQTVVLPDDVEYDIKHWHGNALLWLYKYGVTIEQIEKYKFCYSPSWGRVILPVYDENNKLIFWQGRSVDGVMPKYVSMRSAKKPLFFAHTHTSGSPYVLTEDVLSALAVSRSFSHSIPIALLGTHTPADFVSRLVPGSNVLVWLDQDEPGRKASLQLCQQLKLLLPSTDGVSMIVGIPEAKKIPEDKRQEMCWNNQKVYE